MKSAGVFYIAPQYQPLMRVLGLDAEAVFTHPNIVAWRKLADRENCTLDADHDGRRVRLHIKRYLKLNTAADEEARAIERLRRADVPTITLVGWGRLLDGRSFVITEDLAGYRDAEKLIQSGDVPFETLMTPTAELAGKLHRAGLHHRDLYLCHFFARVEDKKVDVKLIDVARLARLRGLTKRRWIVKDLAQFWFSTLSLGVSDDQRREWLARYNGPHPVPPRLVRAIERKVRAIARHDAKLRKLQPTRNISIPS